MSRHFTMRELPEGERPYEKCFSHGPQFLSDAELIAAIIHTGTKGVKAVDVSREILEKSKTVPSILGILNMSNEDLMKINGVGMVKAAQLKCIAELSKRIAKAKAIHQIQLTSPSSIAEYYMEDLRHVEQEQVVLVMFDTKNKLLGEKTIYIGTVNASLVSPRELFIEALKNQAVYVVLLHNHPSGDPTPSKEDVLLTKRVQKAGNLIGIQLIDHIIIGNLCYTSLKEKNLMDSL